MRLDHLLSKDISPLWDAKKSVCVTRTLPALVSFEGNSPMGKQLGANDNREAGLLSMDLCFGWEA